MGSLYKKSQVEKRSTLLMWLKLFTIVLCLGQLANAFAEAGDELIVTKSIINVRSAPSADSESVIKLKQDRKVTEIQRKKNWIEVDIHRDDIKTGWIHKFLLSKEAISKNTSSPTRFDNFKKRFNDKNEVVRKQNNVIYFSDVKNKGNGQLDIIATQEWIDSSVEIRNRELSRVFESWSNVVPVGSSMSVHVIDEQGEQYTVMLR